MASGAARGSGLPADRLLDQVKLGNALERFAGDRRLAILGNVKELAPQMRPAEGERDESALLAPLLRGLDFLA